MHVGISVFRRAKETLLHATNSEYGIRLLNVAMGRTQQVILSPAKALWNFEWIIR